MPMLTGLRSSLSDPASPSPPYSSYLVLLA
jgi:hypothetical protein